MYYDLVIEVSLNENVPNSCNLSYLKGTENGRHNKHGYIYPLGVVTQKRTWTLIYISKRQYISLQMGGEGPFWDRISFQISLHKTNSIFQNFKFETLNSNFMITGSLLKILVDILRSRLLLYATLDDMRLCGFN